MIGVDTLVALERSARAALPAADEVPAGDWVVRISGGATKRVNSVNPVAPGARVEPVIALADPLYRARSLPTRFRLTPLADPAADAMLAARGYARIDDSWTMRAATGGGSIDPAVALTAIADDRWCAAYAAVSGWSATEDASYRAILARVERMLVATLVEDGRAVGFGLACLVGGQAWLGSIATDLAVRSRGVGRRVVGTLLAGAAADGVGEALLQVLADNGPARALYRSLGFADLYPYHYRIAASGEQRRDLPEVGGDGGDADRA